MRYVAFVTDFFRAQHGGKVMQRWLFVVVLLLTAPVIGACSGPNDSGGPFSIARAPGTRSTTAQSVQVLHTFEDGRDGAEPVAGLLLVNGTAYGTTYSGGIRKYAVYNPAGTIFKIDASGKYSVLYRFAPHVPFGQRAYP
ncbi:MAG: hypothetical protein WBW76_06815, partial [Candidatus Cybelea sp.]